MSEYARYLWLAYGLWEDLLALNQAYKNMTDNDIKIVIVRHMLVDFDSLDTLLREFLKHIKDHELGKLNAKDTERMLDAITTYTKVVEPQRKILKEIRNNLGADRTGPMKRAKTTGVMSSYEWGSLEHFLVDLEARCDLSQWVNIFNAALNLLIVLKDYNLDAWYSVSGDNEIEQFFPIQQPGYYPQL